MKEPSVTITKEILGLIARIDESKGAWKAIGSLAPDRLNALKKIATIESVGSSTRIEGVTMTDKELEAFLAGLDVRSFGCGMKKRWPATPKSCTLRAR